MQVAVNKYRFKQMMATLFILNGNVVRLTGSSMQCNEIILDIHIN